MVINSNMWANLLFYFRTITRKEVCQVGDRQPTLPSLNKAF